MNRLALLSLASSLLALASCDSLVDGRCANGYDRENNICLAHPADVDAGSDGSNVVPTDAAPDTIVADAAPDGAADASPDAMPDAAPDAMPDAAPDAPPDAGPDAAPDAAPDALVADAAPDAPVCTADTQVDPDNCGQCGHVCASGICTAGHCEGEPWGHIVAIGHDYTQSHAAARRVLANAVALGHSQDVGVTWFPGESPSSAFVPALTAGMNQLNRTWHVVNFPASPATGFAGIDVVIVRPEQGDGATAEATGATWSAALDTFLRAGGVVVVLDGANGTNYRFAHGAGLFDVGAPVTVTGQPTAVVDPTDAVAEQVIAPYLAEASSVSWPGAPQPVVTTMGGIDTIVFHLTR